MFSFQHSFSRLTIFATVFVAFFALSWPVFAKEAPVTVPKKALNIKADRMDYDERAKLVRLVGKVFFQSEDTVMTSAFAQYKTDAQVADFQGNVKITQPGSTIVGNKMRVYYAQKKAVLSGNVRLVSDKVVPSLKGELSSRQPAVLSAAEIIYNWETGEGVASGGVKMRQGERSGFADSAVYHAHADTVELKGNVRFERDKDDWLVSNQVTANLADGTLEAQGQVMGRFLIDDKSAANKSSQVEATPEAQVIEPVVPVQQDEENAPAPLPKLKN